MRRRLLYQSGGYSECYAEPAISFTVYCEKDTNLSALTSISCVYSYECNETGSDLNSDTLTATYDSKIGSTRYYYYVPASEFNKKFYKKFKFKKFDDGDICFEESMYGRIDMTYNHNILNITPNTSSITLLPKSATSIKPFMMGTIGVKESKMDDEFYGDPADISVYTPLFAFQTNKTSTGLLTALNNKPANNSTSNWGVTIGKDTSSTSFYVYSCTKSYTVSLYSGTNVSIGTSSSATTSSITQSPTGYQQQSVYINHGKNTSSSTRKFTVKIQDNTTTNKPIYYLSFEQEAGGGSTGGGSTTRYQEFKIPIYFRKQYSGSDNYMTNDELKKLVQNIRDYGEIEFKISNYGMYVYAEYMSDDTETNNVRNFELNFSIPRANGENDIDFMNVDIKVTFRNHNFYHYAEYMKYFTLGCISGSMGDSYANEQEQPMYNLGTTTFTFSNILLYSSSMHFHAYVK